MAHSLVLETCIICHGYNVTYVTCTAVADDCRSWLRPLRVDVYGWTARWAVLSVLWRVPTAHQWSWVAARDGWGKLPWQQLC